MSVMLVILILWKYIQKELHAKTKSLLIILIMMELNFLCEKKIFVRVVYSVLVVKMYWQNIKKFVWALMVHNL